MNSRLQKASLLIEQGDYVGAEQLCRVSIKLGKDLNLARAMLAQVLYNQSVMLLAHPSLFGDAERLLREAVRFAPDNIDVLNNLGALLVLLSRHEEALPILEKVVRLRPEGVSGWLNLALAQEELGKLDAASISFQCLAKLDPENNAAYLLRDALQCAPVQLSVKQIEETRYRTQERLAVLADRSDLALRNPLVLPATYFRFAYHGLANREINRSLASIYAQSCPALKWQAPHVNASQFSAERIRIGLISGFLRNHSIGSISLGLFEYLDRDRFEVFALHIGPVADDETAHLIGKHADRVIQLDNRDLDSARRAVADLQLGVLFYQDVGMEPFSYFLAFARLAPLQLTWFGHPDTTGISSLDAYLSASSFERQGAQDDYTERLVLLPNARTIAYYHRPSAMPELVTREMFGLAETEHLYCCPQQLFKLHPEMDEVFLAICEQDPLARIVLFEARDRKWGEVLRNRMTSHSALLLERIKFLPELSFARYLGFLHLADVVLDTISFNGYNTTLEALYAGVPVVTKAGELQRQRFGFGLYHALGYSDLVAEDIDGYVERALRVVNEPDYRAACRKRIEEGVSSLFEETTAIRDVEFVIERLLAEKLLKGASGSQGADSD